MRQSLRFKYICGACAGPGTAPRPPVCWPLAGGTHGRCSSLLPGPCTARQAVGVDHARAGLGPGHARRFQPAPLKHALMMCCPACFCVVLRWHRPRSLTLQGAPGVSEARRGTEVACQTLPAMACLAHRHDGSCAAPPPPTVLPKKWLSVCCIYRVQNVSTKCGCIR